MPKPFNKAIKLLLATNGLILIATAMLGPIYALFVEEIGGSLLDASYAYGIFALITGISTLISGRYVDKFRENKLIVVLGYSIIGIGFVGYTLVESITTLLVAQVVIGLGEAIYLPAYDSLFSKHLDVHKSGREWGSWEAINYFTQALGAVTGGLLVAFYGFDFMFAAMGLLCFASAAYVLQLPRVIL